MALYMSSEQRLFGIKIDLAAIELGRIRYVNQEELIPWHIKEKTLLQDFQAKLLQRQNPTSNK